MAIYRYLTWKHTLHLQFFFWTLTFQGSVRNQLPTWERSWNHETHNKVMRLAKSAYRTNLCLSKFEKCSSWPGNLEQHFQPPSPEKNKKQRQTCVIVKFNLQPYKFTCKAELPIRAGCQGFPQATFSLIPGCFFRKQNSWKIEPKWLPSSFCSIPCLLISNHQ